MDRSNINFTVVRQWSFNDSPHLWQIEFDNSLMSFCHSVAVSYCFFDMTYFLEVFLVSIVSSGKETGNSAILITQIHPLGATLNCHFVD